MDNSPETKKSPTVVNANDAKPAESPSATPAKSTADGNYKTADIGKWKSKQEDYFAKQNQERTEKKAKQKATFKKVLPFAIAGGVLVSGLIIWGVVALISQIITENKVDEDSIIMGKTSQDIYRYQTYLQKVYDESNGDIEAISQAISNTMESPNGQQYSSEVVLAEMLFYQRNGHYRETINRGDTLNPDGLDAEQKIMYYNMLSYCYSMLGDEEKSAEYRRIGYDISIERGGEGG